MGILTKREREMYLKDFDFHGVIQTSNKLPNLEVLGRYGESYNEMLFEEKKEVLYKMIWYIGGIQKIRNKKLKETIFRMMMDIEKEECIEMLQETYNAFSSKKIAVNGVMNNKFIEEINTCPIVDKINSLLVIRYLALYFDNPIIQHSLIKYFGIKSI